MPHYLPPFALQQQPDERVVRRIFVRVLERLVVRLENVSGLLLRRELLEQDVPHPADLVLKPHRNP